MRAAGFDFTNPTCHILAIGNAINWFYDKIDTKKFKISPFRVKRCMRGCLGIRNFKFSSTHSFEFKNFTRNFGLSNRNFGFSYRNFGFSSQNFGFFEPKFRVFRTETSGFEPKLRVFENQSFVFSNQSCSFCKVFCLSYRNFGISNPYEVSNEVSVEWEPEKFLKFQAKMNDCVNAGILKTQMFQFQFMFPI
jgi:hypothetical protein